MGDTAYWDRVAASKEFSHPLDVELLRGHLAPDASILDYGCGYGRVTTELARAGFSRVVGVDPAAAMIARGRERHPELDLRCVPDPCHEHLHGRFDAVLLFSVLTCVPDEGELRGLIEGVRARLAPGGLLYASDLLLQDDARNRARYELAAATGAPYGVFELEGEGVVLRHYAERDVRELLAGLDVVRWRELDVITMNGHAARAFQVAAVRPR